MSSTTKSTDKTTQGREVQDDAVPNMSSLGSVSPPARAVSSPAEDTGNGAASAETKDDASTPANGAHGGRRRGVSDDDMAPTTTSGPALTESDALESGEGTASKDVGVVSATREPAAEAGAVHVNGEGARRRSESEPDSQLSARGPAPPTPPRRHLSGSETAALSLSGGLGTSRSVEEAPPPSTRASSETAVSDRRQSKAVAAARAVERSRAMAKAAANLERSKRSRRPAPVAWEGQHRRRKSRPVVMAEVSALSTAEVRLTREALEARAAAAPAEADAAGATTGSGKSGAPRSPPQVSLDPRRTSFSLKSLSLRRLTLAGSAAAMTGVRGLAGVASSSFTPRDRSPVRKSATLRSFADEGGQRVPLSTVPDNPARPVTELPEWVGSPVSARARIQKRKRRRRDHGDQSQSPHRSSTKKDRTSRMRKPSGRAGTNGRSSGGGDRRVATDASGGAARSTVRATSPIRISQRNLSESPRRRSSDGRAYIHQQLREIGQQVSRPRASVFGGLEPNTDGPESSVAGAPSDSIRSSSTFIRKGAGALVAGAKTALRRASTMPFKQGSAPRAEGVELRPGVKGVHKPHTVPNLYDHLIRLQKDALVASLGEPSSSGVVLDSIWGNDTTTQLSAHLRTASRLSGKLKSAGGDGGKAWPDADITCALHQQVVHAADFGDVLKLRPVLLRWAATFKHRRHKLQRTPPRVATGAQASPPHAEGSKREHITDDVQVVKSPRHAKRAAPIAVVDEEPDGAAAAAPSPDDDGEDSGTAAAEAEDDSPVDNAHRARTADLCILLFAWKLEESVSQAVKFIGDYLPALLPRADEVEFLAMQARSCDILSDTLQAVTDTTASWNSARACADAALELLRGGESAAAAADITSPPTPESAGMPALCGSLQAAIGLPASTSALSITSLLLALPMASRVGSEDFASLAAAVPDIVPPAIVGAAIRAFKTDTDGTVYAAGINEFDLDLSGLSEDAMLFAEAYLSALLLDGNEPRTSEGKAQIIAPADLARCAYVYVELLHRKVPEDSAWEEHPADLGGDTMKKLLAVLYHPALPAESLHMLYDVCFRCKNGIAATAVSLRGIDCNTSVTRAEASDGSGIESVRAAAEVAAECKSVALLEAAMICVENHGGDLVETQPWAITAHAELLTTACRDGGSPDTAFSAPSLLKHFASVVGAARAVEVLCAKECAGILPNFGRGAFAQLLMIAKRDADLAEAQDAMIVAANSHFWAPHAPALPAQVRALAMLELSGLGDIAAREQPRPGGQDPEVMMAAPFVGTKQTPARALPGMDEEGGLDNALRKELGLSQRSIVTQEARSVQPARNECELMFRRTRTVCNAADGAHWGSVVSLARDDFCGVCALSLSTPPAGGELGDVVSFRCGHSYHEDCVSEEDSCVMCASKTGSSLLHLDG